MGSSHVLQGKVQSIAAGIEDRDRSNGSNLLANVNPTFNWVRLAQRVPVRIALDHADERSELVAGATATVEVVGSRHGQEAGNRLAVTSLTNYASTRTR
jgi:multidrug resistance efflux pump